MSNKYQFDFNTGESINSEYYDTRELLLSLILNRFDMDKNNLSMNLIKNKMNKYINRDILMDGRGGSSIKDQTKDCKKLLVSIMMEQYNITEKDLHDMSIVKSKLRDVKINNILNEKDE